MLIQNLSLRNFRNITEADLEFKPGINLILGENGEGKSSLMYAIAFMLLNETKGTIEDYQNWDSDHFFCGMNLVHNGVPFGFDFNFAKSKLSREVRIGGDAFKGSDATSALAQYFDPSFCKASIVSFQGDIDLVTTKPAQRRDHLKRIYSLEFDSQIANLDTDVKTIQGEIEDVKQRLYLLENKTYDIKPIERPPFNAETHARKIAERDALQRKITLVEQEIERWEENSQALLDVRAEITKAEGKITALTRDLEIAEADLKTVTAERDQDFESKKRSLENLLGGDFEEEKRRLEAEIAAITLDRVPAFDESKLTTARQKKEDASHDLRSAQEVLDACANGECPTCGKEFSTDDTAEHEQAVKTARVSLEDAEKWIAEYEAEKQSLQKKKEANQELLNQRQLLEQKLESEIKSIAQRKAKLQTELNMETQAIEQAKALVEEKIRNQQQTVDTTQTRLGEFQESVKRDREREKGLAEKVTDKPPSVEDTDVQTLAALKQELEAYDKLVQTNEVNKTHNEGLEKQKTEDEAQIVELTTQRDELVQKTQRLERGKVILRNEFPNFVIQQLSEEMQDSINAFIGRVYGGKHLVSIKQVKNGIEVVFGKKGRDIANASGFETQLFNLAYKHAFAQISDLKLLILDEIDSNATETNSRRLYETLGLMLDDYDQILVITHKSVVQDVLITEFNAHCYIMEGGRAKRY